MKEKFYKYMEIVIQWLMKYFNWMNESNRALHLFVGAVLFDIIKMIGFADFVALSIVICAAIIKEIWNLRADYDETNIDKKIVWKFDWLDILAIIIIPLIQSILI